MINRQQFSQYMDLQRFFFEKFTLNKQRKKLYKYFHINLKKSPNILYHINTLSYIVIIYKKLPVILI